MSDNRVYSYSAVLMGSPILLKLCSHDEAMASRVFQLIKRYEDLLTVNRAESQVMDINHAAGRHPVTVSRPVFQLIQCAKAASMVRDSARENQFATASPACLTRLISEPDWR